MNREIKFRAWNPNWDEMVYSTLETVFDKREFYSFGFEVGFSHYPEEGWIIAQYTGLKDKNGKEVYEGDIVAYEDGENSFIAKVVWGDWLWFLEGIEPIDNFDFEDFTYNTMTELEVIGNIHDNPELLEVE